MYQGQDSRPVPVLHLLLLVCIWSQHISSSFAAQPQLSGVNLPLLQQTDSSLTKIDQLFLEPYERLTSDTYRQATVHPNKTRKADQSERAIEEANLAKQLSFSVRGVPVEQKGAYNSES